MAIKELTEMTSLVKKVNDWTDERGFLDEQSLAKAVNKIGEEIGEISSDVARSNYEHLKDSIGDTLVTIINAYRKAHPGMESLAPMLATIITERDQVADKVDPDMEMLALYATFGNLTANVSDAIVGYELDDLGFTQLIKTLGILAHSFGLTLRGCLEVAYDEIKDRNGSVKNGVYVKDEDQVDLKDHDDIKNDLPEEKVVKSYEVTPEQGIEILHAIANAKNPDEVMAKLNEMGLSDDSDNGQPKIDPEKIKQAVQATGDKLNKASKVVLDGLKDIVKNVKDATTDNASDDEK